MDGDLVKKTEVDTKTETPIIILDQVWFVNPLTSGRLYDTFGEYVGDGVFDPGVVQGRPSLRGHSSGKSSAIRDAMLDREKDSVVGRMCRV